MLEAYACERCGNAQIAVRHLRLADKPADPDIRGYQIIDTDPVIDWATSMHPATTWHGCVQCTRATSRASSRDPIRSCHADLDEFYSRLRIIYREREDPRCWMTFRKD